MLEFTLQVIAIAACVDAAIIIREKRAKKDEMEEEDV